MNGWVYEGYIDTIIDVFNEVDGWIVGGLDRINSGLPDYKLYPPTHFRTNTMKNSNGYKTVDIFYLHKKWQFGNYIPTDIQFDNFKSGGKWKCTNN